MQSRRSQSNSRLSRKFVFVGFHALDHIVGWFDKWIMYIPHPEYDAMCILKNRARNQRGKFAARGKR
jgi:hypothetical protein